MEKHQAPSARHPLRHRELGHRIDLHTKSRLQRKTFSSGHCTVARRQIARKKMRRNGVGGLGQK
jgi:hypothetical protein